MYVHFKCQFPKSVFHALLSMKCSPKNKESEVFVFSMSLEGIGWIYGWGLFLETNCQYPRLILHNILHINQDFRRGKSTKSIFIWINSSNFLYSVKNLTSTFVFVLLSFLISRARQNYFCILFRVTLVPLNPTCYLLEPSWLVAVWLLNGKRMIAGGNLVPLVIYTFKLQLAPFPLLLLIS